jgi:HK97 family phage major capsid protein
MSLDEVSGSETETTESPESPSMYQISMAFDDFMRAFHEYKATNDRRLAELESKSADVITEEKLARIDAALDEQKQQIDYLANKGRLVRPGETVADTHKAAFTAYVRKGDAAKLTQLEGLSLEGKALSVGSEADGGYLVPEATERAILKALADLSPIRGIAGHITISSSVYKRPFAISGANAGWVGETAPRPQTAGPRLAELSFPTRELYAMPAATVTLLDDAAVDVESWLADEVRDAFAQQEGIAFVSGDGESAPKGFLSYTAVPEDSWSWGNLGYVATGVDGGFDPEDAADVLIDLVFSLKAGYRRNARFVMNRLTQSAIRKLRDGDGTYLWEPSLAAGLQPMLFGYPITECDHMPDMAPGSLALAFGDFNRGYLVVDRAGIQTLRDPFTAKPYVTFYTTKRVGGGVQDFNAIKLLKFSAS